jgi:hypothetical protein
MRPKVLELLSPEQLSHYSSSQTNLDSSLAQVLCLAWQGLQAPSLAQAAGAIAQAEFILCSCREHCWTSSLANTPVPLKAADIQDYDQFFHVRHIQSESPAAVTIASLITAIRSFLDICLQKPDIEPVLIERQLAGFKSHIQLLARLSDVHLEDSL